MPRTAHQRFATASCALAACAAPVLAQTEWLIGTGDVLTGLGTVDEVFEVATNAAGDWIASVRTDQMPLGQVAVVRNGTVVIKPGDIVPGITSSPGFFAARGLRLNAQGDFTWTAGYPTISIADTQAGYLTLQPYAVKGDPVAAPGITPGTTFQGVYDIVPGSGGTAILHAIANDAAITGIQDHMVLSRTPSGPGTFTTSVIAKRGDLLPGAPAALQSVSEALRGLATNASGSALYIAVFSDGTSGSSTGIYLDQTALALSDTQSPVFGSQWANFSRHAVALNDAFDFAYTGDLAGSTPGDILVWNGIKLVQEGDLLPDVFPFQITGLRTTPSRPPTIDLAENGRVMWYGEWDDPDSTRDTGLFIDQELVLQEGLYGYQSVPFDEFTITSPTGQTLAQAQFDLAPDGTNAVFRAQLADGRVAAFRLVLEPQAESIPGCAGNAGILAAGGALTIGATSFLQMSAPQVPDAVAFVGFATTGFEPCGVVLAGIGEALIGFTPPNPFLVVPEVFPTPMFSLIQVPQVPANPLLVGQTFWAQGIWFDPAGLVSPEPFRLTNALKLPIGQP